MDILPEQKIADSVKKQIFCHPRESGDPTKPNIFCGWIPGSSPRMTDLL